MKPKHTNKKESDAKELTPEVTTRFLLIMNEIIVLNKRTKGPFNSRKEFALSINTYASNFTHFDNPESGRNVTIEICCQLCKVHDVNANWLLLEIGEKYNNHVKIDRKTSGKNGRT